MGVPLDDTLCGISASDVLSRATHPLPEPYWKLKAGGGCQDIPFISPMEKVPELRDLSSEAKRYASIIIAAVLSMAAFTCSVALGYSPQPESQQAWAEALFAVAFVATGLSQVIHGRVKLRGK